MKKIRNIQELENEKLKLKLKQLELEKRLDNSWKELRNSLSMDFSAEQKQADSTFNFKTGNAILNGALSVGAILLSVVAGRTLGNAAERIVDKLGQKVNSLVSKANPPK